MRRLFIVAVVLAAIAFVVFEVQYYRYRFVRENADLVKLLPPGEMTIVYADLSQLRRAQLLGVLANIKVAPDKEYSDFLQETGFDYSRDLNAIAIGVDSPRTYLVGRGKFDWKKLEKFSESHNGRCGSDGCLVPGTTPGRWVNLITVQPDVLAVAISPGRTEADSLRPPGRRLQEDIPSAPIWAKLSHALLVNPMSVPVALRIFAISLQSSQSVTVFATADSLQLKASFVNSAAADTARGQLELQTKMLQTAFGMEKADRASIAGLLTAGTFRVSGTDLNGRWPVTPELLRALQ